MPLPEKELIARIRRNLTKHTRGSILTKGIGDDCAVLRLPAGHEALVTTDFSLEGVHFRREWHPAEVVGHRCLTRGLSDIAAMGGKPAAAFLSLALPPNLEQRWVDGFMKGFTALAKKYAVNLAGGDTAQSPTGVLADVMVVGSVPRGKAVLRSGAKVGDDIYVTGKLGMGVAALNRLLRGEKPDTVLRDRIARKHFYPEPRIGVGEHLRERGLASAMIDISDGLSTDLAHICEESGVSAWIAEEAIPVAPGATLQDALHGGDEYELIFAARPQKHRAIPKSAGGVSITWIGTVTESTEGRGRGANKHRVWLVNNDRGRSELVAAGWEHFR
jgi:thiamine-monophosphate kinase